MRYRDIRRDECAAVHLPSINTLQNMLSTSSYPKAKLVILIGRFCSKQRLVVDSDAFYLVHNKSPQFPPVCGALFALRKQNFNLEAPVFR
jgi:hypothetical protein